jgi:hypothetical protein
MLKRFKKKIKRNKKQNAAMTANDSSALEERLLANKTHNSKDRYGKTKMSNF